MCARCCASSPRPALAALRCWQRIMVAFKGVCTKPFWRAVSAEFLATLIFVLLSLGSTISWPASEGSASPVNLVLISLCFGLSIATMVQCFGHISGGHLNPAVTVAMVVTRKLSLAKATFYLSAQCLGAIAGAGILYLVTPSSVRGGLGVTMVNSNITVGHALVVETVITFELIFTVFATCDPKRTDQNGSAGLAIGLSVAIGHFFAVPYTGASMNPARSFGPAVITNSWDNHWVYWVAPLLGGVLAAALYEYLFCPNPVTKKPRGETLSKDASGKYQEVESPKSQPEDLAVKPGSCAEKGRNQGEFRDSHAEVQSSV
ncbi:aquaporin-4-like isoform X1 [Denticeps clupeoides]|uniref:aquaporin-4-like isoform X1 n=1 Tax=Denticeps clupeoides TaxID=299321 RepID=UPI0010A39B4A|nr:aquaporin-4 isoform X1 [Denticeps clupeoides]